MSSPTNPPGPQSLGHPHGPARILAYICRPQPPASTPSASASASSSSSPFVFTNPPEEELYLYPELQVLDHLFLNILPALTPDHSPIAALERALSSAASRHRYCYYDTYYPNHPDSLSGSGTGSPDADAEA